jgi:hypothetical protein
MAKALQLSADEIVEVIEDMLEIVEPAEPRLGMRAQELIEKLIGEDRQGRARFTTKFVLVDDEECHRLAADCGIAFVEAKMFFTGEPIKYARAIAEWALEQADKQALGLDQDYMEESRIRIHAQRGRMVADILGAWAYQNQRGLYRMEQPERMGTPQE